MERKQARRPVGRALLDLINEANHVMKDLASKRHLETRQAKTLATWTRTKLSMSCNGDLDNL